MPFPFGSRTANYVLLRPSPKSDSSNSIDSGSDSLSDDAAPRSATTTGNYLLLLCLIFTALNGCFAYLGLRSCQCTPSPSEMSRKDVNLLRRPSQYMYFDTIPRPEVPIAKNFTNFPIFTGSVDFENPNKVFEPNSVALSFMTHAGTIYPEDKRLRVTQSISTVIQFRAIDWGMEICEVHVRLPRTESPIQVSIFRLESNLPIDPMTLTYRTLPKRVSKLADITTETIRDTHWHRKLACATEEVLTFELACSSLMADPSQCSLDWWQPPEQLKERANDPSVYIVQHATK